MDLQHSIVKVHTWEESARASKNYLNYMDTTITSEKKAAFKEKEGNESYMAGKRKRDRKNKELKLELETKQTRTNSSSPSPMLIFLSSLVQKT